DEAALAELGLRDEVARRAVGVLEDAFLDFGLQRAVGAAGVVPAVEAAIRLDAAGAGARDGGRAVQQSARAVHHRDAAFDQDLVRLRARGIVHRERERPDHLL